MWLRSAGLPAYYSFLKNSTFIVSQGLPNETGNDRIKYPVVKERKKALL